MKKDNYYCATCKKNPKFGYKNNCIECIGKRATSFLIEKTKKCFLCPELITPGRVVCDNCFITHLIKPNGKPFEGMDFTRELARIRDKHTCQDCGKKWILGTRRFDIHHLEGCGEKSRSYDKTKDIGNLTTLCHKCHLNLPEVRDKISNKSSPRKNKDKIYQKKWAKENRDWINEYSRNRGVDK